jgi:hypothetical protein
MGTYRSGVLLLCLLVGSLATFVPSYAQTSGAPALPQVFLDTRVSATRGKRITVPAGGDLQAALDAARPGDTILVEAGATFVGNFVLPAKRGSGVITVRTSTPDAAFPSAGTRVGPADALLMPKLLTATSFPALTTAPGAHHYRLVGLELGLTPDNLNSFGIVLLGDGTETSLDQLPHDLVVDRCYVHGNPTGKVQRGITLNSASTAVVDSYVANVHLVDTDASAITGWNGPGPFKIVNNYVEGTGSSILFGGADPAIDGLVPSDVEIRANVLSKPLSWKADEPDWDQVDWRVKNLLELKNARRVLVDGNTIENAWVDAQNGFAVLFTVRNQDGTAPWSTVEDVTFTNNVVRHASGAINILGNDNDNASQRLRRVLVANNHFEEIGGARWGGGGHLFLIVNGSDAVTIDHNTGLQAGNIVLADGPEPHTGFVYTNNVTPHNDFGIIGSGAGPGNSTLGIYFPGAVVTNNVIQGGPEGSYPAGNFFPATLAEVGFVDAASGDYRLDPSSAFRRAGTDGVDLGADVDAIAAAAASVAAYAPSPAVSGASATATATSATITWATNVPADSQVEYGTTAAYGNLTPLDETLTLGHSAAISGLSPRTTYHYRVLSRDYAGRLVASPDRTFATAKR